MVMLIPIVTLLLPLMRFAPPVYKWQVRRRIFRWYGALRDIEERALAAAAPAERTEVMRQLDKVEEDVGKMQIPLGYEESHYQLRMHIQFIRKILLDANAAAPPERPDASSPAR
jgi:hypothetical protein